MNKLIAFSFFLCITLTSFSQNNENSEFCTQKSNENYFPLDIEKKIIIWDGTYYVETKEKSKEYNKKTYCVYKQKWEKGGKGFLYLRAENGIVYEYDKDTNTESVRVNPSFKIGRKWESADGREFYKVISYKGTLKTKHCSYENLLVIKAQMKYGTIYFYYQNGQGYVGAKQKKNVISYLAPRVPKS